MLSKSVYTCGYSKAQKLQIKNEKKNQKNEQQGATVVTAAMVWLIFFQKQNSKRVFFILCVAGCWFLLCAVLSHKALLTEQWKK